MKLDTLVAGVGFLAVIIVNLVPSKLEGVSRFNTIKTSILTIGADYIVPGYLTRLLYFTGGLWLTVTEGIVAWTQC